MVVFAKSYPLDNPESLEAHTKTLLRELERIKTFYGDYIIEKVPEKLKNYFWNALELVCKSHDLGKIHTPFQNAIRKKLKLELLPVSKDIKEIPHNLLSAAFLSDLVREYPKEIQDVIFKSVAFHHNRGAEDIQDDRWKDVVNSIEKDLKPNINRLSEMKHFFDEKIPEVKTNFRNKLISILKDDYQIFFVLLKGIFHRIDYSASAQLDVEIKPLSNQSLFVTSYLISRGIKESEIWQKKIAENYINDCIVFQASTGIGKTEFSLYWLGNGKGFYTLPVRTSVNAMYERLKETFNTQDIGLLHSDNFFYAIEEFLNTNELNNEINDGFKQSLTRMDLSKQLAMPITVSTADQLFTSVFKYKGYEKIYATLAYSKIIIDEIQSYDPDMVAVILKGLEDIYKLGGKFCIVTATLPEIYLKYIEENIPSIKILPPKLGNIKKHKIQLLSNSIIDNDTINIIQKAYEKYDKVLIIVNTIKRSQELYEILKDKFKVTLLHSGFIYKDRRKRESKKEDNSIFNLPKGIWITTQLSEVSLDIDFPVMITEISTIDSQVQRWGRVNRQAKFDYNDKEPNVYICQDASGLVNSLGKSLIYDKDLIKFTTSVIQNYDNALISQQDEYEMIQKVFSDKNFSNTNYFKKFNQSLKLIKELNFTTETKSEAQKLFRKFVNINVIPYTVYIENELRINEAVKLLSTKNNKEELLDALYTIKLYTLSLPVWIKNKVNLNLLEGTNDVYIANINYSSEVGINRFDVGLGEFL